jgi:hypothetical protein
VGDFVRLEPVMSDYLVGTKYIATAVFAQPLPSPSAPVLVSDKSTSVPIALKINSTAPVFSLTPSGTLFGPKMCPIRTLNALLQTVSRHNATSSLP